MTHISLGALAALLTALATPAFADALEDAHAAYEAAWEAAPLAVRKAVFVTEKASGFGIYDERASNAFAPDEPLLIYVEPVGYGFNESGGMNAFGTDIGVRILTTDAEELFVREKFLSLATESADRPTEFFGNVTLTLSGLPVGGYVLELNLSDVASDETAQVTMPFEIK